MALVVLSSSTLRRTAVDALQRAHLRSVTALPRVDSMNVPVAAAIGRTPANRAIVASTAAALAGGVAYIIVLALLRTPELRSLFSAGRRAPTRLDV